MNIIEFNFKHIAFKNHVNAPDCLIKQIIVIRTILKKIKRVLYPIRNIPHLVQNLISY